jgi:UDP-galactopyranose mutase
MNDNKGKSEYDLKKKTKHVNLYEIKNTNYLNGKDSGNRKVNGNYTTIKDIICFSHLRWDFVFQRPQHLLTRWAKEARVFYFEEPVFGNYEANFLRSINSSKIPNVVILTPHIKEGLEEEQINIYLEESINKLIKWNNIQDYLLWYITPMAMPFSYNLDPQMVVYDCMDELSCFKGAHPNMMKNEASLLKFADVVFTGGYNLYKYKKDKHHNIHPFPSSIDQQHFESGIGSAEPLDQVEIPHPRVGFFGVIDERLDIELLDGLALKMPSFQFIMIGPVVKIDPASLPKHQNIYYLGQKGYNQLPAYIAHWDVAFLPFAKNDSTRFISPTKTPEYLCAGKPVVSTSILDVVTPYGELGLVHIADNINDFSIAIEKALLQKEDINWQHEVREFLKTNSWDLTWLNMKKVILDMLERKKSLPGAFSNMMHVNGNGHANGLPIPDHL